MPQTEWLTLNKNRRYPFVPSAQFDVDTSADFPDNAAFVDAGFTLGIDSNFQPGRDRVYLDEWRITPTTVYFSFKVAYGESATYDPFRCYRWVFEFDRTASFGATSYSVPERDIGLFGSGSEQNPLLGLGFLTIGDVDAIVAALGESTGFFVYSPQVEPAALQTQHNMFVKQFSVANEPRPCPPECDCPEPPSSSSSSSAMSSSSPAESPSVSSSSSSSSSQPGECTDPIPPEPTAAGVPTATTLPDGVFIGDVKLKEGYNSTISVSGNLILLSAGVGLGEGVQCEDLRMNPDGSLSPESCLVCGGLLYALNGQGYDVESMQLIGQKGVVIEPDVANHRVVVRFEEEGICEVDI